MFKTKPTSSAEGAQVFFLSCSLLIQFSALFHICNHLFLSPIKKCSWGNLFDILTVFDAVQDGRNISLHFYGGNIKVGELAPGGNVVLVKESLGESQKCLL